MNHLRTIESRAELAFREMASRRLSYFLRYRFRCEQRKLTWNWHLDYLCDVLEAVTTREIRRVILNVPPRMLKSELFSQTWQPWMIGREDSPRSSMVSASATAELGERDSRISRNLMESDWYKNVFPEVKRGSKWTDAQWETAGGATRNGRGAEGTIIGFGGDHLLGDDLLKADESNSEVIREKRNLFMAETMPSRHNDIISGTTTIIMQRLHERDTTGYLLEQMKNPDYDQYMHIMLPNEAPRKTVVEFHGKVYATRETGDLLFPARLNAAMTRSRKATMKENYEGQYNQRPTKMEGGRLRPALLQRIAKTPSAIIKEWGLTPIIAMDLATKAKETVKDDPDYSVIQVWGKDQMHRRWLLYCWRKQTTHDQVASALISIRRQWCVNRVYAEKIGLQHTFRSTLKLACQLRGIPYFWVADFKMPASTDPIEKITPFESALNAGMTYVPAGAQWLPDLESEMRAWPKGSHDDQLVTAGYINSEFDAAVPMGDSPPPAEDRGDAPRADSLMRAKPKKNDPEDW